MKLSPLALLFFSLTLLTAPPVAADPSGGTNYGLSQTKTSAPRKYYFVGWPAGSNKPVYFRSALYPQGDSATFVRLDDNRLFGGKTAAGVRFPGDFDSLRATNVQPVFIAGSEYAFDGSWVKADVAGKRWIFPRVSGEITLWTKAPRMGSYVFMDTGAGMEPYREAAVRAKIATRPEAARLLGQERFGKNAAWTMALGGAALAGLGIATSFGGEEFAPNGLVFGGITVAAFSWLPHLMVQGHYERAVRAYNAAPKSARSPVGAPGGAQ